MHIARIQDNSITQPVISIAPGVAPEQAAVAMGLAPGTWREITEAEAVALQAPSFEDVRVAALETLRLRKWEAKNAGITVNGIAIDTDDRGQATIAGAVVNVMLDASFTAHWKTAALDENGGAVWLEVDGPMIIGLSRALTRYTEACFAVEAAKQAELAALGDAEAVQAWLADRLDEGWPSQEVTLAP